MELRKQDIVENILTVIVIGCISIFADGMWKLLAFLPALNLNYINRKSKN